MSKRAASPPSSSKRGAEDGNAASSSSRARTNGADVSLTRSEADDEGMGEFEDQFEDELESEDEDEEIVDANDEEDGEMEIDGVKVDGEIQRLDGQEEEDEERARQEEQVYLPGDKLEEGQTLEPDQSAYEMLHRLNVTWPCLSFDVLQDSLGSDRQKYPHTAYFAAGTQADVAKNNELMVMKASSMHKTIKDGAASDDEDEDDDDDDGLDDDAILEYRSIPHMGGINRVRAAPVAEASSSVDADASSLDPYPVACWSELGKVNIYDVRPLFNALERPGTSYDKKKVSQPLYTVEAHRGVEGYAMDWAGSSSSGASRASSLRLLTGDLHSNIYLTTSNNSGFTTNATPFASHTSSVEDLQWSPSEQTVFASCSADCSVRVWDVRVKSRKSVIAVDKAHPQDVNVISWNRKTEYLLLSGGDEGGLNVWDLRNFKSNSGAKPTPVASFNWHTAPISSVEWHPTEDSVFAASGRDDQVTLWDLSVEQDDDEAPASNQYGADGREVPSQLLFCHQGASEIKEVHWHKQIPGALISTSADGFHLFKTISV